MPLPAHQTQLAVTIDTSVWEVLAQGGATRRWPEASPMAVFLRRNERHETMSTPLQAFLANIGPRPLTYEEARELQRRRMQEGQGFSVAAGVIRLLAEEAGRAEQAMPEDAATESA